MDYRRNWNEINRRKITKQKINNANDEIRTTLLAEYSEINKRVKMYSRRDKWTWADKLAHKAQLAAETNNSRELYQITKQLAGKTFTSNQEGIRDTTGRLLITPQNQLTRWQEYFKNTPLQHFPKNCAWLPHKDTRQHKNSFRCPHLGTK